MDFSDISGCFCPLLSFGKNKAVECHDQCMMYKHETGECILSRIASTPPISRFCTTSDEKEANDLLDLGWIRLATAAGSEPDNFPVSLFVLGWPAANGKPEYN